MNDKASILSFLKLPNETDVILWFISLALLILLCHISTRIKPCGASI